jgi:HEPN domain-containing protein
MPQPRSVEEWLRYARGDLRLAKTPADPDLPVELLCFHTQQAAERAIKAVLIHLGVRPPWTHAIEELLHLLPAGVQTTPEVDQSARLSAYATTTRYPRQGPGVTDAQHREALRLAEAVVQWATQIVAGTAGP